MIEMLSYHKIETSNFIARVGNARIAHWNGVDHEFQQLQTSNFLILRAFKQSIQAASDPRSTLRSKWVSMVGYSKLVLYKCCGMGS